MRTHAQQEATERIDAAVLAGLKHEGLYIRDIRRNMKDQTNISEPTIFRSLSRLVASGKAIREDRAKPEKKPGPKNRRTSYKGHGPEPTVFWRRV